MAHAMTPAQAWQYGNRLQLAGEVFLRWTDATQTAVDFVEPDQIVRD